MSGWPFGYLLSRVIRRYSARQVERAFWTVVMLLVALVAFGLLLDVLLPPARAARF